MGYGLALRASVHGLKNPHPRIYENMKQENMNREPGKILERIQKLEKNYYQLLTIWNKKQRWLIYLFLE